MFLKGSLLTLALSFPAFASVMPGGLRDVSGVLLNGVTSRGTIVFHPGDPGLCSKVVIPPIIHYACPNTQGASATVTGDGQSFTVNFNSLHVYYKSIRLGNIWQYDYSGKWTEGGTTSRAAMTLWFDERVPGDVRGVFNLVDFGVSSGIKATQAPRASEILRIE